MTNKTSEHTAPKTMEIDAVTYITIADFARAHDANGDRLRGLARDGKLAGARQILGNTWIIPIDATVPAMAERVSARPDGRKPYTLYATPDELVLVASTVPDAEIIDPRAVSKAKRAAAKLADANAD